MHNEKRYANLVFYLETCFSGSMFNNLLPEDINVYALTAANPYHSSYACFCEEGFAKGLHCLGDCFSYAWISDSTWSDPKSETLQEQYEIVKEETTSSIVSRYGQMSIREKPIAEFQGPKPINPPIFNVVSGDTTFFTKTRWPSDDVPIMYADYQLRRLERMNASPQLWIRKSVELRNMKTKRSFVDDFMQYFVKGLVHDSKLAEGIITNRETPITKFDCHEAVVTQFMTQCFRISEDPYVLSKLYVLVNLCESGIDAHRIIDHMKLSCPYVNVHGIV
ncbi:hypothetical protein AB6A40_006059 [Gnathostoma spinigerum]|uniref:Legumain prodomain domain-containing protein n=1 Tax=Gnathostoma spinigerum TaxID=75299 RepID=A0ABD6ESX1_9BILA